MNYNFAKKILKTPFHIFGLDLIRRKVDNSTQSKELPFLYDHPLEAIFYCKKYQQVAFRCPIRHVVSENGLSYSPKRWHPYVATLLEYADKKNSCYGDSILKKYFDTHQPAHAGEAVVGFNQAPSIYSTYSSHMYRVTPWKSSTAEEVDRDLKTWEYNHGQRFGKPERQFSLSNDGYQFHGPVSMRKGQLEYRRLITVYESIKANGYDRRLGHAGFLVMKRENSYRYLSVGNGNHRTAAMSALGHETIPAVFEKNFILDIDTVAFWPQVQQGLWTIEQAEAYFNHLFDFDSRSWAQKQGLL